MTQSAALMGQTRRVRQADKRAWSASGPFTLNKDQIAERGARMARRDDREYREYLREEQRRQPRGPQRGSRVGVEEGCPARKLVVDQRIQATSRLRALESRPRTTRHQCCE